VKTESSWQPKLVQSITGMQNNITDRILDAEYLLYLPLNDLTQFSQHWEMWKYLNENNE
jgi:hypothetical protein